MKKIFSKITNNRRIEFQIETSIYSGEEKKCVIKRALGQSANNHINNVYNYYEKNAECGLLCKSRKISDGVIEFDYINGKTLFTKLLGAIQHNDSEEINKVVNEYKSVVVKLFDSDKTYEELITTNVSGANIDLTFDNIIINDGNYTIIDYEWILDNIDVAFIVFRAVFAIVIKYGSAIEKIMKVEDFYKLFKIDVERIGEYLQKNNEFNEYVYGKEESYDNSLAKYAKKHLTINKTVHVPEYYAQFYIRKSEEYTEDDSVKIFVTKDVVDICYEIEITDEIEEIRIDPLNCSCICENIELVGKSNEGEMIIDSFKSNAYELGNDKYLFCSEDPQIILEKSLFAKYLNLSIRFTLCRNADVVIKELDNYMVLKKQEKENLLLKEIENNKKLVKEISIISEENHQHKINIQILEHDKEIFKEMGRQLQKRLNEVMADNKVMKIKGTE